MITSLAIILLPVQAREKFLEQVRNSTGFVNFICTNNIIYDNSQGLVKNMLYKCTHK